MLINAKKHVINVLIVPNHSMNVMIILTGCLRMDMKTK
jgi:hypothetical protein